MTNVNRIPYNSVPQEWAFDGQISPFMQDVLDILRQLRDRSGGDTDLGDDFVLLDGSRAFTGDIDNGGNSLTNVNQVDGRDISVDGTKLDGIEAGATQDQTNAEIKTAWEAESGISTVDIIERDGSVPFTGPPVVPSYTVAGLPSASTAAQMIYVSDETGGAVLAFSDGTNWRRSTDRAIVS